MKIPNSNPAIKNRISQSMWDSAEKFFEDIVLKGVIPDPAELEIIPTSGTAHWFWTVRSHQIRVCADALDVIEPARTKNLPLLIKRLIAHEVAHAVRTARHGGTGPVELHDLRKYIIETKKLSFALWNCGEDCWIENWWRQNINRFGWTTWLDTDLPHDYSTVPNGSTVAPGVPPAPGQVLGRDDEEAHRILLDIKMLDGKRADLMKYLDTPNLSMTGWWRVGKPKRQRVYAFYKNLIKAEDSWGVADLMDKFRRAFPEADMPVEPLDSPEGPGGDPKEGWQDISDRKSTNQKAGDRQHGSIKIDGLALTQPNNFRSVPVNEWKKGCGDKALAALRKGLKRGLATAGSTTNPSSNINIKDFLAGKPDCYRKTVQSRTGKKQRVEVVFDLSSSMCGDYHEEGIKLMDALKTLHDSGEIELRITWVSSFCLIQWHGDQFQNKDLAHVIPNGGSPLGQGLNHIEPDLNKDVLVLGYTDGAIDFDTYDRKNFLSRGVRPVGAFITDSVDRLNGANMKECFDQFEVSGDLGSLSMGLGKKLKTIADLQA